MNKQSKEYTCFNLLLSKIHSPALRASLSSSNLLLLLLLVACEPSADLVVVVVRVVMLSVRTHSGCSLSIVIDRKGAVIKERKFCNSNYVSSGATPPPLKTKQGYTKGTLCLVGGIPKPQNLIFFI